MRILIPLFALGLFFKLMMVILSSLEKIGISMDLIAYFAVFLFGISFASMAYFAYKTE